MTYYFTDSEGALHKVDTSAATLLLRTREVQARWQELYLTAQGNLVRLDLTRWQGEHDCVSLVDVAAAVRMLALSDPSERTDAGDAFLQQHEADFVHEV